MKESKRNICMKLYVSPEEKELIESKMDQLGTTNTAAYLRKMAIDGFIVNLDMPELKELLSLLRRSSNNLNQLTRRVHETNRIYDADIQGLREEFDRLWNAAGNIVSALAGLR